MWISLWAVGSEFCVVSVTLIWQSLTSHVLMLTSILAKILTSGPLLLLTLITEDECSVESLFLENFQFFGWNWILLVRSKSINSMVRLNVICGFQFSCLISFYGTLVDTRPAQFLGGKCLKLHGGPWAKMWVHTNFYQIRTSFDHVSRGAKYCAFCCNWPKHPNFRSPRDVVKWRTN